MAKAKEAFWPVHDNLIKVHDKVARYFHKMYSLLKEPSSSGAVHALLAFFAMIANRVAKFHCYTINPVQSILSTITFYNHRLHIAPTSIPGPRRPHSSPPPH